MCRDQRRSHLPLFVQTGCNANIHALRTSMYSCVEPRTSQRTCHSLYRGHRLDWRSHDLRGKPQLRRAAMTSTGCCVRARNKPPFREDPHARHLWLRVMTSLQSVAEADGLLARAATHCDMMLHSCSSYVALKDCAEWRDHTGQDAVSPHAPFPSPRSAQPPVQVVV